MKNMLVASFVVLASLVVNACGSESVVGPSAVVQSATHDDPAPRVKLHHVHGTVVAPGALFYYDGEDVSYGDVAVLDSSDAWHRADITTDLTFDVDDVAAGPIKVGVYSYGYRTWYRELELFDDIVLNVSLEAR